MTDNDLEDIKNSLADASDDERRKIQKFLKSSLPDASDNRTCVGFRTSIDDKTLLRQLATSSNTSVSSLCRTTIRDALRQNFGG
jgi:hypothetical protein